MKPTEGIDHIDAKSPAPQNRLVWKNCMSLYRTRKAAPSAACRRLLVEEGGFIYDSDAYSGRSTVFRKGRRVVIGRSRPRRPPKSNSPGFLSAFLI